MKLGSHPPIGLFLSLVVAEARIAPSGRSILLPDDRPKATRSVGARGRLDHALLARARGCRSRRELCLLARMWPEARFRSRSFERPPSRRVQVRGWAMPEQGQLLVLRPQDASVALAPLPASSLATGGPWNSRGISASAKTSSRRPPPRSARGFGLRSDARIRPMSSGAPQGDEWCVPDARWRALVPPSTPIVPQAGGFAHDPSPNGEVSFWGCRRRSGRKGFRKLSPVLRITRTAREIEQALSPRTPRASPSPKAERARKPHA